jgi:CRISPR system Cascade subunit CasB
MTDTTSYTELVKSIVDKKVWRLQNGYLANRSAEVGALARLRRGLGKPAGSVLDILEFTHADELAGRNDEPTFAETAVHLSMTLYALHQQSQGKPMHQANHPLGRAIRKLIPTERGENYVDHAVAKRFAMLGTADSLDELTHHMRGMVQLLRAGGVPLDYGRLAADLLHWQRPNGAATVRLRWGRDFHQAVKQNDNS